MLKRIKQFCLFFFCLTFAGFSYLFGMLALIENHRPGVYALAMVVCLVWVLLLGHSLLAKPAPKLKVKGV